MEATYSTRGGGRVFRSDDGGATWIDRTAGLPNLPINAEPAAAATGPAAPAPSLPAGAAPGSGVPAETFAAPDDDEE